MSQLRNFLINEKVSRNEIEEALSSKNVMVGAEFEFLIPQFIVDYRDVVLKSEKQEKQEDSYQRYDDALELWKKDPINNPKPTPPEWALQMGYKPGEQIKEPAGTKKMERAHVKLWRDVLVEQYLLQHKLPFDNYIISTDHKAKSGSKWVIKPDGSLGLGGVEVVTPVLTLKEFLEITPKMFEFIDKFGPMSVIDNCGFHISISLKNVPNLGKALDVIKLSLFLDEGYIYKFFKMREFNTYAKSAFDAVRGSIISKDHPELMKNLVDEQKLKSTYSNEHYMAINIEHLNTANEYIEFRYVGGKNYHHKWDRIKAITAHYIYNLSLACDPTYKVKEYGLKMTRILNKIQFFTVCTYMTELLDETDNKSELFKTKEWKNLMKVYNALKVYGVSIAKDEDEKGSGQRGFTRLCKLLNVNPDNVIWDFSNVNKLQKGL